jgi:hypothetical protein
VEYSHAAWAIEHCEKVTHETFSATTKYYTGVPADLQKQAAEALGELLVGAKIGPTGDPTPGTLPSNPEELTTLKAELRQKLLLSFGDDRSGLLPLRSTTSDFGFGYSGISPSTTSMMPPAEPRSQLRRNAVNTKFAERPFRNCLENRDKS